MRSGVIMISIERDGSGRTYQIWKQNQMNSCGIACMWMARGIARQTSFAEEEWNLAVRLFGAAVGSTTARLGVSATGPMSLNPRAFSNDQSSMAAAVANFGFNGNQLAAALRVDGLRVETNGLDGSHITAHKIAYNRPGIALVLWSPGPGGHFVVVGRCTHRAVSFLDPWDGHINEQYNNGQYTAPYGRSGQIAFVLNISA